MALRWLGGSVAICLLAGCSLKGPTATIATSKSASGNSNPVLLPVKVSDKWGYVNASGQLVINPQFDYARDFREGRAAICIGKPCDWWKANSESVWGFVDTTGKVIVTPQYEAVSNFSEGLASVCTGDCTDNPLKPFSRGYIDRDGHMAIPAQFGVATDFSEGLAQVCIGDCQWKEGSGYSGKFGFIDHTGHFVINPQYDDAGDFKDGFAKVSIGKGKDARSGYIDKSGKVIWQPSN